MNQQWFPSHPQKQLTRKTSYPTLVVFWPPPYLLYWTWQTEVGRRKGEEAISVTWHLLCSHPWFSTGWGGVHIYRSAGKEGENQISHSKAQNPPEPSGCEWTIGMWDKTRWAQPLEPRGPHKARILWIAWMEALLFLHTRLQYNIWDMVSYPYIIQRLGC